MFKNGTSYDRHYFQELGKYLADLKDDIPFNLLIKKSRDSFIEKVYLDEIDKTPDYIKYRLTVMLLVHFTYYDDKKVDRVEKKLLQALFLSKKDSFTSNDKKYYKRLFKQDVSKQDIIEFVTSRNVSPKATLKAMDIIISYLDLRDSYSKQINDMFNSLEKVYN